MCTFSDGSQVEAFSGKLPRLVLIKKVYKEKLLKEEKNGQRGAASWWRVCYQLGLPRLFFNDPHSHQKLNNWLTKKFQTLLTPTFHKKNKKK